jgi:hypothetical protein
MRDLTRKKKKNNERSAFCKSAEEDPRPTSVSWLCSDQYHFEFMLSWAGILLFVPATRTLKLAGKNKSALCRAQEGRN